MCKIETKYKQQKSYSCNLLFHSKKTTLTRSFQRTLFITAQWVNWYF